MINQKKIEERKKEEEVQKVLNAASLASLASKTTTTSSTSDMNNIVPLAQAQPNRPLLSESQIRAKSILLAKHNVLKTTNDITREDKFLCNIFEKYQSLRSKYESNIGPSSFRNNTELLSLTKSPDSLKKNDPTVNRNKILDIYLIKSQLRINDSFKFADKIFQTEIGSGLTQSSKVLKTEPSNLLPIPMTTSNLVENLNTNRNLYVANSKPLLIKRNLELSSSTSNLGNSNANTVSLLGKINMEKIRMIEKKNNELLLKDTENYKYCFN